MLVKIQNFEALGLSGDILKGVLDAGFTAPTPVQAETIPHILKGRDVLAQAHTGTGKTAAFGLPVMSLIQPGEMMMIISPTRELAMQVSDELYKLGRYAGIRTATICGGQSYARQKSLIASGVQVVTATPGRLMDLLENGSIDANKVKYLVLDEADEMLDMGFLDDIKSILSRMKNVKQTLLFSATLPKTIEKLAETFMKSPVRINTRGSDAATNADIDEIYYVIEEYERDNAIIRLIDYYDPVKAIIFTRTKKDADRVSTSLLAKGYTAKCLHGDLTQPQREEVTKSFRRGDVTLLAATDVAARGLDIADVSHVFNYHLPFDSDSYVHRVGRTGRAGNKGMAVTLVTPQEYRGLTRIQKATGAEISYRKVPSLSETNEILAKTLVEKVRKTPQSPLAVSIVELLERGMDIKEAALRLASLLWSGEEFSGPEHLGVAGKKLDRLHSGEDDRRGSYSRDRGGDRDGDRNRKRPSHGSHNRVWFERRKEGGAPKKGGSGPKKGKH